MKPLKRKPTTIEKLAKRVGRVFMAGQEQEFLRIAFSLVRQRPHSLREIAQFVAVAKLLLHAEVGKSEIKEDPILGAISEALEKANVALLALVDASPAQLKAEDAETEPETDFEPKCSPHLRGEGERKHDEN